MLQLAHLKNDSGFYDKAIIDYTHYLEVNPSDADARIDMGVCYYNLQNYPKAIEEMEKALTYQPTHQIAHLNLGVVTMASGNIEAAKQWLEKAVKLNPNTDAGKRAQELLSSRLIK
ncbi:MAG: tetratricopeptide repeat protein [Ignavibacteriales bacterium]|nr:tetratricopeptide repeat protein [Ignavibacteriales bacterium]